MFTYLLIPTALASVIFWLGVALGIIPRSDLPVIHGGVFALVSILCFLAPAREGSTGAKFVVWLVWTGAILLSYNGIEHPAWVSAAGAVVVLLVVLAAAFSYAWFRPTPVNYHYGYHHPIHGTCMIRTNGRSLHETEKEVRREQREGREELRRRRARAPT